MLAQRIGGEVITLLRGKERFGNIGAVDGCQVRRQFPAQLLRNEHGARVLAFCLLG